MVEELVDDDGGPPPSAEVYAALVGTARRTLALAAELGVDAGEATRDFGDDPAAGTFEIAAVTPLGMLDRQRVLERTAPPTVLAARRPAVRPERAAVASGWVASRMASREVRSTRTAPEAAEEG